jgi:hypothetical protein
MAQKAAVRHVSELQSKGPDLVAETRKHPVELHRYSETVAYLVSPEDFERARQLEEAAHRVVWTVAIQRGLKSLAEGRVTEWDATTAERLRARFPA